MAPLWDADETAYRVRLLGLAAFPRSVLLENLPVAEGVVAAIVQALEVIFAGYPVGRPH